MTTALLLLAASSGLWLDVPFVKQEKNGCGSASVAMILRYWNRDVDPRTVHRDLYASEEQGILASALVDYFQRHGFRAFTFRGSWDDLHGHLAKGRPLIAALREASPHYVVVAGLDEARGIVLVNDPARRKLVRMDRAAFERAWLAMERWTLLAVPR